MKWTDIYEIAESLNEHYPDYDVMSIKFTDLRRLVMELPDFDDKPGYCNEKILEAIQAAWLEEQ